jgi:hypothetical protein
MAPSAKPTKGGKSDLRMFFGPGGGQPKTVKVANSQVRAGRSGEWATLTENLAIKFWVPEGQNCARRYATYGFAWYFIHQALVQMKIGLSLAVSSTR